MNRLAVELGIALLFLCNSLHAYTIQEQAIDVQAAIKRAAKKAEIIVTFKHDVKGIISINIRNVSAIEAVFLIANTNGFYVNKSVISGKTFYNIGKKGSTYGHINQGSNRVYTLEHIPARAFYGHIKQIFNDVKLHVDIDARTNSIIATGNDQVLSYLSKTVRYVTVPNTDLFLTKIHNDISFLKRNVQKCLTEIVKNLNEFGYDPLNTNYISDYVDLGIILSCKYNVLHQKTIDYSRYVKFISHNSFPLPEPSQNSENWLQVRDSVNSKSLSNYDSCVNVYRTKVLFQNLKSDIEKLDTLISELLVKLDAKLKVLKLMQIINSSKSHKKPSIK